MHSKGVAQCQQPCSACAGWTTARRDSAVTLAARPCCPVGLNPGWLLGAQWREVPVDLLCMAQCCISFLLIRVPASWLHAVFVVGNGPLEVRGVGLGASRKSPGFHCWKASVHFECLWFWDLIGPTQGLIFFRGTKCLSTSY